MAEKWTIYHLPLNLETFILKSHQQGLLISFLCEFEEHNNAHLQNTEREPYNIFDFVLS